MPSKPKKSTGTAKLIKRKATIAYYKDLADYNKRKLEESRIAFIESSLALTVNASSHIREFLDLSLKMYAKEDPKFLEVTRSFIKSMLAESKILNIGLGYLKKATQVNDVDVLLKHADIVREHISGYDNVLENAAKNVELTGDRSILKPPEEPIYHLTYITYGSTSIALRRKISEDVEGIGLVTFDHWKRVYNRLKDKTKALHPMYV